MSRLTNNISNTMSLRRPLAESLQLLDELVNTCSLIDSVETEQKISKISEKCPLFTEFDREFPSIAYSIATGVGKTRLMAAFLVYLVKERGIKNFFILSPNITIYEKLIEDFGNSGSKKYVFKGFPEITSNINIITGEDYETKGVYAKADSIQLNMFNISKINADVKTTTKDGQQLPPRIKRFRETLGDSYYNYLKNLEDLVIIMDESHHYRGERGMETLNELNPILGIELTATPIDSASNSRFNNIVYEYGLADALKEGKFIKNPAVVTRADTQFDNMSAEEIEKIKLNDAIQVHNDTKLAIENYAAENNKPIVKPTILVSCRDTDHAAKIFEYITSDDFHSGKYKEKVLQIDSKTKTEDHVNQLLSLEHTDNPIEIVVHVDMLKEGWDVANLYTIVPLRAANAITLVEQTIGRGLRLPYGAKRTEDEKVDMLSIMMHDKFEEIVEAARDENSLLHSIGQVKITAGDNKPKEVYTSVSVFDEELEEEEKKISKIEDNEIRKVAEKKHKAKKASYKAVKKVIDKIKVHKPSDMKTEDFQKEVDIEIKNEIDTQFPELSEDEKTEIQEVAKKEVSKTIESVEKHSILIPNIRITVKENKTLIADFDLDTNGFTERILQQEFELLRETLFDHKKDRIKLTMQQSTFPKYLVLQALTKKPEVDYNTETSDLLTKLCEQAVEAVENSLENKDALNDTITAYVELIANKIYMQLKQHITIETISESTPEPEPFKLLLNPTSTKLVDDDVLNYKTTIAANLIRQKLFNGFSKACHTVYKFDSLPEKRFAEILEDGKEVIKWLRPAHKQFNIRYNNNTSLYVPDFVAETDDIIYMIEIKAENQVTNEEVQTKADAAINYCKMATEINLARQEKAWKYVLIPDTKIELNMSFSRLVKEFVK